MDYHRSSVPWNTLATWQEANACMAYTIRQNQAVLAESRRQAHQIKRLLESTFPRMDRLCRKTCPDCTDICCHKAWVWVDFKDLLFLHLAGIPAPGHQLLSREENNCRYGGSNGCRLDRIRRPFVCTWYLCPAQTQCLRKKPAEMQVIQMSLRQIKELRHEMERSFIWAVT
jgi:hypothetical protein